MNNWYNYVTEEYNLNLDEDFENFLYDYQGNKEDDKKFEELLNKYKGIVTDKLLDDYKSKYRSFKIRRTKNIESHKRNEAYVNDTFNENSFERFRLFFENYLKKKKIDKIKPSEVKKLSEKYKFKTSFDFDELTDKENPYYVAKYNNETRYFDIIYKK